MPNKSQSRFTQTNIRFFDVFCLELLRQFNLARKIQLNYTALQTESKLIIIYQNNELNLANSRDCITVTWWSGYHRYNGEPHPDYPLTQHKRSYYKLHEKSGKVFSVGLSDQGFNGHQLYQIEEATEEIVRRFCWQGNTMPLIFGKR